jgi:hypothetical protein
MSTKDLRGGKVRPARTADNSAVLVLSNTKVRMEAQRSIPFLSLRDLVRKSFAFDNAAWTCNPALLAFERKLLTPLWLLDPEDEGITSSRNVGKQFTQQHSVTYRKTWASRRTSHRTGRCLTLCDLNYSSRRGVAVCPPTGCAAAELSSEGTWIRRPALYGTGANYSWPNCRTLCGSTVHDHTGDDKCYEDSGRKAMHGLCDTLRTVRSSWNSEQCHLSILLLNRSLTGLEQPRREPDHLPPSYTEVNNQWMCASSPPICVMAWTGTALWFCVVPKHVGCHGVSGRMQAFCATKLPSSGTRWKGHMYLKLLRPLKITQFSWASGINYLAVKESAFAQRTRQFLNLRKRHC